MSDVQFPKMFPYFFLKKYSFKSSVFVQRFSSHTETGTSNTEISVIIRNFDSGLVRKWRLVVPLRNFQGGVEVRRKLSWPSPAECYFFITKSPTYV